VQFSAVACVLPVTHAGTWWDVSLCCSHRWNKSVLPVLKMMSQIKFQAIMRFFLLRGANEKKQQQKLF